MHSCEVVIDPLTEDGILLLRGRVGAAKTARARMVLKCKLASSQPSPLYRSGKVDMLLDLWGRM